jgi:hypothetical protein
MAALPRSTEPGSADSLKRIPMLLCGKASLANELSPGGFVIERFPRARQRTRRVLERIGQTRHSLSLLWEAGETDRSRSDARLGTRIK